MAIEFIHGGHDAVLEFLFGCDTDMAQHRAGELGEEAFDEIEPGAVLGREGELEAAGRLIGEPSLGLLGDVRGMIVEDQLDRRMSRIGGVEKLEEFDEFAAAVAVLDKGMNLAGEQINAGQQTDRAVALVFVIAGEGRMPTGLGGQVRSRRRDRLNARLLVIRDNHHRIARLLLGDGRSLLDQLHLAIDAQHLRHLCLEVGVAAFEVVAHFVRLDLLLIEDVAQRALSQLGKARVSLRRPMLAGMAGEQSRRPQFVWIPEFLGLAAGEIHNPCLGFGGDRRLLAGPWPIVERRYRTIGQRPLNTALGGLMVHPHGPRHRKKRRVFPVGQKHSRTLDTARWFRSRARNRTQRRQIILANSQFDRLPPTRHDLNPRFRIKHKGYKP
jgi:hypothetical protein